MSFLMDGRIAITGITDSSDIPMVKAFQSQIAEGRDAYITVFNPDGQSLAFSTYLGGDANDAGRGLEFTSDHKLVFTGRIGEWSRAASYLPQRPINIPAGYGGGTSDACFAKISESGDLEYFVYFGGEYTDIANDITVDPYGNLVITGSTMSPDLPLTNPVQSAYGRFEDGFIARISPDGRNIDFASYYGGSMTDIGTAVQCPSPTDIFLTGYTSSSDLNCTYMDLPDESISGKNVFLCHLTPKDPENQTQEMILFGGQAEEASVSIAFDTYGYVYLTGFTFSSDFPSIRALQPTYAGDCDMFVAKYYIQYDNSWRNAEDDSDRGNNIAAFRMGSFFVSSISVIIAISMSNRNFRPKKPEIMRL